MLLLGDALKLWENIPNNSVNLIIADPPYFKISKEKWDQKFSSQTEWIDWCLKWTKESERTLVEGGQLWVWGAIGKYKEHPFLRYLLKVETCTNLIFRNWITMRNFRCYGNANHFPFARQEALVFSKGTPNTYIKQYSLFEGTNRLGAGKLVTNIWLDCKDAALFNKKDRHKAEKPYLAVERIIRSLSLPNDLILIPFAGSGVECKAARILNRRYLGFEIDPNQFKMAKDRIRQR